MGAVRYGVLGLVLLGWQSGAKPPRQSYDAKKDQRTYSSGDIRTGGLTGMSAEFLFPGKVFSTPEFVNLGVGSLRIKKDPDASDDSVLLFTKVNEAHIKVGADEMDIDAKPGWQKSRNSMVKLIYGNAIEEFADIHLSLAQFHRLATSTGFTVTLGHLEGQSFSTVEERTLKESQIKPLKALDACLGTSASPS
jgi:hypothetical protein